MNQIHRLLLAALFAMTTQSALAHGKLLSSDPANGSAVATAPVEIRMKFSEPIEIAFTSVKLLGPEAKEIATVKAQAGKEDARTAVVPLPGLAAGNYRAQWSTMGHDGHHVKGEIAFTVK